MASKREPLLQRALKLERKLLLENCFTPAPVEVAAAALEGLGSCTVRIGAHTFPSASFYAPSVLESAPSQLRRSSLSLVQMFLNGGGGGERTIDVPTANEALSQSPAACSIRDLLARNPSLVQLLNGTISTNNKKLQQQSLRSRPVYFSLQPHPSTDVHLTSSLLLFPSTAIVIRSGQHDILAKLSFEHLSEAGRSDCNGTLMIIQGATVELFAALTSWTRDPTQEFADFLPKINNVYGVAYREILFPCHLPNELLGENLVKSAKPTLTDPPPASANRKGSQARGNGIRKASKSGGAGEEGSAIKGPTVERIKPVDRVAWCSICDSPMSLGRKGSNVKTCKPCKDKTIQSMSLIGGDPVLSLDATPTEKIESSPVTDVDCSGEIPLKFAPIKKRKLMLLKASKASSSVTNGAATGLGSEPPHQSLRQ